MATRKFKTYCRIIDYVDSVDPELSELIRGTCADLALGSTKGKPGITFLMPQDKTFRKKLSDLAYSEKVEDANKASDMLNALIFRDLFKSPSDWMSKKDDIPNSLFPSQHVEIDSATGTEIVFKSGARATLDTNFKDASRRSNLAVWKLVSGEIPVTTDQPAKLKYARANRKGGKTGGYEVASAASQGERFKMALAVENAYVLHELQRRSGQSLNASRKDIYLEYTLSLVNYILNVRKDTATLYEKILPLISFDKIDFYLLVEPHKFGGEYLLDDTLIREWWLQRNATRCDYKSVCADIERLLTSGSGSLVYSGRAQLLDKIAEVRDGISQKIISRPRGSVDVIESSYAELEKNNTIGGLGPVYPSGLAAMYAAEPGLKMLQDELRYITYGAFKQLECDPAFDTGRFNEIVNMIGECLYTATPDERARQQKLLNKNSIKYQISPNEKIDEIRVFLYSTMFMYVPMTEAEATNLKQKHSIKRPDPKNIVVFNIAKDLYIQHVRLLQSDPSGSAGILDALKSLNMDTLDPALRDELKRKLGM